ncbi:TauD/TfdA family dioxygenase [Streptomyces sp. NPDC048644]|uniref:TauD/TfdA family dioxygenase n=1 Tax=Streptomyces sp. NPDC048644 TaxID=3365582 RepID=UPI0037175D22
MTSSARDDAPLIEVSGRTFHPAWLRYSCPCVRCRHPESFQKVSDLSARPDLPEAAGVELDTEANELRIDWREEPAHRSCYPLDWLLLHSADTSDAQNGPVAAPWDAATLRDRGVRWHEAADCGTDGGPWFTDLQTVGFALLKGLTPHGLERLLSGLAPVFYTEYGRQADVRAVPGAEDLAETESALPAHTDYPYKVTGPLTQFCYYAENQATGGELFLVDGFRAAEDFRREHPRWFDLLTGTPVGFEQLYTTWRYLYRVRRPIISLDGNGAIDALHLGHSHAWAWEIAPERCGDFYRAYHGFVRQLGERRYHWSHRYADGECVVFRNNRILHGRDAFDPRTGVRHLITAYVPWQQLESRVRFHQEQRLYLLGQEQK